MIGIIAAIGVIIALISSRYIAIYCNKDHTLYLKTQILIWIIYSMMVYFEFNTLDEMLYILFFSATLYIGATIDSQIFILPNEGAILLIIGRLLAIVANRFFEYELPSLLMELIMQSSIALIWMFLFFILRKVSKDGLGLGDVKWIGAISFCIPWYRTLDFILYAFIAGSFYSIARLLLGRLNLVKCKESLYIPFGPFLAIGALIVIWG